MNQSAETKSNRTAKAAVIIAIIAVAMAAGIAVFALNGRKNDTPNIGYAMEAKVMLDESSLQAAVDEAIENAQNGMVALQYQNDAFSSDGKTFSCHIVNAPSNLYDMFLAIYADEELTDQIFLSGLVPPGSGFEEITLNHALDTGNHTVQVAVTQVETDDSGGQTIKNQVLHTIEFHVVEK